MKNKQNQKRQVVKALLDKDGIPPGKHESRACPSCGSKNSVFLNEEYEVTIDVADTFTQKTLVLPTYICEDCEWEGYPEESMKQLLLEEDGRPYLTLEKDGNSIIKKVLH